MCLFVGQNDCEQKVQICVFYFFMFKTGLTLHSQHSFGECMTTFDSQRKRLDAAIKTSTQCTSCIAFVEETFSRALQRLDNCQPFSFFSAFTDIMMHTVTSGGHQHLHFIPHSVGKHLSMGVNRFTCKVFKLKLFPKHAHQRSLENV